MIRVVVADDQPMARERLVSLLAAEGGVELAGTAASGPEAVDCIPPHQVRSSTIIDNEAIVFDAGATIYVNRPRAGRESLDQWDTLVTRPFGSRLCSIDTVRLLDATSRMETGTVFLGEFVPYRRKRTSR